MNERDRVRLVKEIPIERMALKLLRLYDDDLDSVLDSLISEVKLEMEATKLSHYDVEYFIPLPKVEHKKITIALLDPNICNSEFGFYKEEIVRMRDSLWLDWEMAFPWPSYKYPC